MDVIHQAGKGAILYKRDVKSAFRTIRLPDADMSLHGIHWNNKYAFEQSLARGQRIISYRLCSYSIVAMVNKGRSRHRATSGYFAYWRIRQWWGVGVAL